MDRGHPALLAWLHDRIRTQGPIPFVEFMEAVLYHPDHGYYCRPEATTGPDGDFYTSSDVHPAFGRLLARQISEIARKTAGESTKTFHVVEVGPGTGKLARDILAGLLADDQGLARRVRYTLVEVSPSLRKTQEATLTRDELTGKIAGFSWMTWQEVLEEQRRDAGGFTGCVVANEFLDALPVNLVERGSEGLMEVHVESEGAGFREVLLPPGTDRLARHWEQMK